MVVRSKQQSHYGKTYLDTTNYHLSALIINSSPETFQPLFIDSDVRLLEGNLHEINQREKTPLYGMFRNEIILKKSN